MEGPQIPLINSFTSVYFSPVPAVAVTSFSRDREENMNPSMTPYQTVRVNIIA